MKYYAIAEIDITDQSWVPAYVKNVTKMVEASGGRFLARTGKMTGSKERESCPRFS